jgi:hypothetical protein
MKIAIYEAGGEFTVWIEPGRGDKAKYSWFCAGIGKTKKQAVSDARKELEKILKELEKAPAPSP